MVLIQLWGAASAALVVAILFATFQTWVPAEAIRSSSSSPLPLLVSHGGFLSPSTLPSFKEAPCFNNQNSSDCFPSPDEAFVCDPISVHIAMTLDAAYLRGSMAAVFSILKHASCPSNVVFHFLVCEREHEFATLLRSTFPNLNLKTYFFNETLVRERISSSVRQALEQPLNYARNYLADILEPCVRRVIYLDSDVVVVDDITKLWSIRLAPDTAIGAPEYCHANFSKYFTPVFWSDPVLSSTFRGRSPCYFNTGVMIMELEKWRAQGYTSTIEKWMEIQKERRIYELGSLPPFLLVFAGKVEPVEHRWNQHGLGGDFVKGSCRPLHSGPVSLLHWSGNGKPWLRLDSGHPCPLDSLWAPYDLYLPQSSLSS